MLKKIVEMDDLIRRRQELMEQIQVLQKAFHDNEKAIEAYRKTYGIQCTSCGRFFSLPNVHPATQDDIDSYIDSGEGYAGPTLHYPYCGC